MKIKKEDIRRIINILESKDKELKEGEYFEFNGRELVIKNIPNKWAIRDYPEIKEFFEKYHSGGYTCEGTAYLHYPKIKGGTHVTYANDHCYYKNISAGYEEITIEQFREFIKDKI